MKLIAILLSLLMSQTLWGQDEHTMEGDDTVAVRLVLIGDAGDAAKKTPDLPVVRAARKLVTIDKKTTVIYLGDNLYSNGLVCEEDVCYQQGINVLDTQAGLVLGTEAKAYFIPGNHDWAQGKPEGYDNILRQGRYVDGIAPNVQFLPKDGCPGPSEVQLGNNVVLVIMDSQWWLNRRGRPGLESDCPNKTEDEVLAELKDILDRNPNKLILYACHHPFRSTGPHSGYFGPKQWLFPLTDLNKNLYVPLPGLGFIYTVSRSVFGSPQDVKFPSYQNMIHQVDDVLKAHPHVIHLAGHDHNLQLMKDSSYYYVLSGGGCKTNRVGKGKKTHYSAASMGFAVMDISTNKTVSIRYYEVAKTGEAKLAYSETLLNYSHLPPLVKDTAAKTELITSDSVTVSVNKRYLKASGFKRFWAGNNYRKEWGAPVMLKVFHLHKEKGGFKVIAMKGGKQTRSLHLEDKSGKRWVLRTVNKNPEKAIPRNFRRSFAEDVVQDMISASDPYGALGVPPLAEALDVTHPSPEYFFVPDDYAFGRFRPIFANSVCSLEELEPSRNTKDLKSTTKMFNKLLEDNDRKVDQKNFLKARMLDFLVADFDRHGDQWKWGTYDSAGKKYYYPVPRDRDQAFFYSDGLLLKWASRSKLAFMKGFRYNIPDVKNLGYVARDLDRMHLNELDENEWKTTLADFKQSLTDSVLHSSATAFPDEINRLDSSLFLAKLKSRRDLLPEKGLEYYKFLSKKVIVFGTNNNEYFDVTGEGRNVRVTVYALKPDGQKDFQIYSRLFNHKTTKSLALYGFNGNDYFKINNNVRSKIKMALIGGLGNDTFNIRGRMPNSIYDLKSGKNVILSKNNSRNMMSNRAEVNNFTEKYNYNIFSFPKLKVGYNEDDKLLVGVSMLARRYDFRKEPFASQQTLGGLASFQNSAWQVYYNGEFNHAVSWVDLVLCGEFVNPNLNNFFGFGNETVNDLSKGISFYRVRYSDVSGTAQFRYRMSEGKLSFALGPTFYHYWYDRSDNNGRILSQPYKEGLDSNSIYNQKNYAGGKLTIRVNNLNDDLFPTRGVDWITNLTSVGGLDKNSMPLTKLESDMVVYGSLAQYDYLVGVLRLGGGHIYSENFEYFQALSLGLNNYLRGFRKNRFSGNSLAYGSLEMRARLFHLKSYIIPGEFGLVGFDDIGRVWLRGENSRRWHNAYGGGFYFMPFNLTVITATIATSGEETLFNFTLGTKLNVVF